MPSPLTLRIDEKTRRRIARIARRKGLSTSDAVRQAIDAWAEQQEPDAVPYDLVKDLIGVVHGDNPRLSERTGKRFAELLKARATHRGTPKRQNVRSRI